MLNTIKRWLVKEVSPVTRGRSVEAQNDASGAAPAAPSAQQSRVPATGAPYVRVMLSGDTYRAATDKAPMQAWLVALPATVRPVALAGIYPRIVKKIMRLWADDVALRAYMEELTIDRRGGRIGFPPKGATEILRLQVYIHQRTPAHNEGPGADSGPQNTSSQGRCRP